MYRKILILFTLLGLCLLAIVTNLTTPTSVGPFGVLAVFVFIYMLSLGLITYILFFGGKITRYLSQTFISRKPIEAISFRMAYYYASVLAAMPVLFAALKSVGAVSIYGFVLVFIFEIVGCLYVSKKMA